MLWKPRGPRNGETHLSLGDCSQCAVPDLGMTHDIGCVRVKEMGFLEAPALGHAIKHITEGQKSLYLQVMAMGWDLGPSESEVWNGLTSCWPSPGLDPSCRLPQSWWSWDTRARSQTSSPSELVSDGELGLWKPEQHWLQPSHKSGDTSSCYQQQNWQGHQFLWEAAASGEHISFRKHCVLICLKQAFLRFSGSHEVKRKACFRLRENGKKPNQNKTTVFCHLETLGV